MLSRLASAGIQRSPDRHPVTWIGNDEGDPSPNDDEKVSGTVLDGNSMELKPAPTFGRPPLPTRASHR